ncbi:GntR family transcriptional regulator [Marinivivus vitaminiproducens]|uniref:GntR family transcriptional regulator n=1 Tax=Marinivivus vitaminiproducens TaxID=3035935 RepID=UPI0027AA77D0|nr:GntR family transcriptional regulator [Geminicoccaceae bacterium SCSIO 64248]
MSSLRAMPVRDRSRHAAPQVFDHLRERICSLELAPGTVLSRQALQDQFGLSSTPIRDALLRLQEEALVEIFPQHATVVSPIDLRLARQAQFLRVSVEQELVRRLAATPDERLVARMRAIIAMQQSLVAQNAFDEFVGTDQHFHRLLYEAAEVPDLWFLIRRQSGHIDRLRRLHLPMGNKGAQIVDDHTAIVEAIAGGNPSAAQDALREHLSRSLALSGELKERFPTYFRH